MSIVKPISGPEATLPCHFQFISIFSIDCNAQKIKINQFYKLFYKVFELGRAAL